MTLFNLKKMFFMLFEEQDYKHIEDLYFNYRYMVQNEPDIAILHAIAIALNGKTQEGFEILANSKSTGIFINPGGYISAICDALKMPIPEKYRNIDVIPVYSSPGYNMITLNGTNYDSQMDAVRLANEFLGTPAFKSQVEAIDDINYRNHLKLIHAINAFDLDYGIETALDIVNAEKQDLNTLALIINILSAKQRIDIDNDISKTELFAKLETILKDTLHSLNLLAIKKVYMNEIDFLKELNATKKHLYLNHPKEVVDEHWAKI